MSTPLSCCKAPVPASARACWSRAVPPVRQSWPARPPLQAAEHVEQLCRHGGRRRSARAQATQALACRVDTSVHMNPVLLKPESDVGSQVVVQGKRLTTARARDYYRLKPQLLDKVLESYRITASQADLVIVEGAGSAAEVNLRAGDIANMGFAEAADVPVVLVGDIDRGGVIAQIGDPWSHSGNERARIRGFIVNRFRGDPTLFDEGQKLIADRTGWPAIGIAPWFPDARKLPAEDSVELQDRSSRKPGAFALSSRPQPHTELRRS